MPPSLGFQALTPSFLLHKANASLDQKEAYGLARLLSKVDERDVSPEQSRPALLLALNVLRHLVVMADSAEAAERGRVKGEGDGLVNDGDGEVGAGVKGGGAGGGGGGGGDGRGGEGVGDGGGDAHSAAPPAHTHTHAHAHTPPSSLSDGKTKNGVAAIPAASDTAPSAALAPAGRSVKQSDAAVTSSLSSSEEEGTFRAKCVRGIQDVLTVNRRLEEKLREEHGHRVKAEDDVASLKRALSLIGLGSDSRLAGGGRCGSGRLADLTALPELNRAAIVIQRRHRGVMGRRHVREYCSKVMAGADYVFDGGDQSPSLAAVAARADKQSDLSIRRSVVGGGAGSRGAARRRRKLSGATWEGGGGGGGGGDETAVRDDKENRPGGEGGEVGSQLTMTAMRRRISDMESTLRVVASRHEREIGQARSELAALREMNAALSGAQQRSKMVHDQQLATLSSQREQLERERIARQEVQRELRLVVAASS